MSLPPAVKGIGSPTSFCGRCHHWICDVSCRRRRHCSSSAPQPSGRTPLVRDQRISSGGGVCRRLDGIPLASSWRPRAWQSMTATEVRDRLDDRFSLLVGSRRGLERHQTLRHAVAWSYDLLDDDEKSVLEPLFGVRRRIRPSSAYAVMGSEASMTSRPWTARRVGSQVTVRRRSLNRAHSVFDAGDHPPVRRRTTRRHAAGRPIRGPRMPATSHGARPTSCPCGIAPDNVKPILVHRRAGQSAHRISVGSRPRRPRYAAAIATYAAFLGYLHRQLRANRLGRRIDRARPRRRPSPARIPLCDRFVVLHVRTG